MPVTGRLGDGDNPQSRRRLHYSPVRASQRGPAWRWLAGPFLKKGGKYIQPPKFQRTNRCNENDGVSKRVHELAFGIVICFGSAEFLHIFTIRYIDASLAFGIVICFGEPQGGE